jgi:hypothetical protein
MVIRDVRPVCMVTKTFALMLLYCVVGMIVEMEVNEWRVAERRNYGETQIECERPLHEGPL